VLVAARVICITCRISHCIHNPTEALASSNARSVEPTVKSMSCFAEPWTAAAAAETKREKVCSCKLHGSGSVAEGEAEKLGRIALGIGVAHLHRDRTESVRNHVNHRLRGTCTVVSLKIWLRITARMRVASAGCPTNCASPAP